MKKIGTLIAAAVIATTATAATSITRHHITWTFDKDYSVGEFANGDPYVIGPVKIVSITNDLSDETFKPKDVAVSGSQINPVVVNNAPNSILNQGFDERTRCYIPELNASLPGGNPLSKDNPLALKPNESLVSVVSWLWLSPEEKEKGCPKPPPTGGPKPTLRTASVLTCLDKAPPAGSFRPAYCGADKTIKHNIKDVKFDRLLKLAPIPSVIATPVPAAAIFDYNTMRPNFTPSLANPNVAGPVSVDSLRRFTERVWIDHIPTWYGCEIYHAQDDMPGYGREIANVLQSAMLALHLDWDKFPEKPKKDALVTNMVQIAIDLTGAADNGSFWPADGGHGLARMPAILFAGLLLDDPHMKNIGNWDTQFQDRQQTFYVSEKQIEATNNPAWIAEYMKNGGFHLVLPYTEKLLGMPEWGVQPQNNIYGGAGWSIGYRDVNATAIPGFALALMMMEDGRKLFAHEAYFDYADRLNGPVRALPSMNKPPVFAQDMWDTYRAKYPTTYDKKWDAQEILDYVVTPNFHLRPAPARHGTFDTAEPILIQLGHPAKLSALKPADFTLTDKDGEAIKVEAIEAPADPADHFTLKITPDALKPGGIYTLKLAETATTDWRDSLGRPLMSHTATIRMK